MYSDVEADVLISLPLGINNGGTTRAYLRVVCRLVELPGLDFWACFIDPDRRSPNNLDVRFVSPRLYTKAMASVCCLPYLHLAFLLSRSIREQGTPQI